MSDARRNFHGQRLIIFGAGYVGSELARQAQQRGLTVTALTRNAEKARELQSAGIEVVVGDLASAEWHPQIKPAADFVVNCVSSGGGGVSGYRQSYRDGLRSILGWAGNVRESNPAGPNEGIGTFVYTSSTSVYPQSEGLSVDETFSTDGSSETAQVLVETENLVSESRRLSADHVNRWFILRLAGIYGPGRHHILDQIRAQTGEVAGVGNHRLNLIHRDDVVAAIWAVLEAPDAIRDQIFNVTDDCAMPKAEVVAWLAQRLGVQPPRFTGQPAGGRRAVTPDRVILNGKIKTMTGWSPRYFDYRRGYESILLEA